jgi:hypothetical protein
MMVLDGAQHVRSRWQLPIGVDGTHIPLRQLHGFSFQVAYTNEAIQD